MSRRIRDPSGLATSAHQMDASKWVPDQEFAFQFRPEMAAGGYARDDSTVEFYQRVMAVLPDGAVVLDLGAGRGGNYEIDRGPWKNWLVRLGNRCSRRIGADIDPAILTNPALDEAKVLTPGEPLPFSDGTFDLVLCDWVMEHVADPATFVADVRRVLKTGGWFCARTPNKWSYFSMAARAAPRVVEGKILNRIQPNRAEADVFEKHYRMNTIGTLRALFNDGWNAVTYTHNPAPAYHANSRLLFRLISLWQSIAPKGMGTVILLFARKTRCNDGQRQPQPLGV